MGILKNSGIKTTEGDSFLIHVSDKVRLYDKLGFNMGWELFNDDNHYIDLHAKELKNINFKSLLMFGLGLGLTCYLYQNTCEKIHIIENSEGIIDVVKKSGLLKNNIIIHHADVLDFSLDGNEKFDLIFVDIYGGIHNTYFKERSLIINNYKKNLTEQGVFYFPDSKELISLSSV